MSLRHETDIQFLFYFSQIKSYRAIILAIEVILKNSRLYFNFKKNPLFALRLSDILKTRQSRALLKIPFVLVRIKGFVGLNTNLTLRHYKHTLA